jgi:hypothetical protein
LKTFIPLLVVFAASNCAASIMTSEDYIQATATLNAAGTLTLQTYGFGGGTNGAGTVIEAGGFDPLVAVFDDTGNVIDGTSDILTNYGSWGGCPPAGTVTIGTVPEQCADITMSFALGAGTYTIVLSDAAYIPSALFGGGNLSDGFTDLTTGLPFQTCANSVDCNNDTPNWALDVTTPGQPSSTGAPEPGAMGIAGLGLLGLGLGSRYLSFLQRTK